VVRDKHPRRTLARFAGHLSLDTGHNLISVGAGSSMLIMRRVSKLASPQKLWKLATCRASVFVKFFTGKAAPRRRCGTSSQIPQLELPQKGAIDTKQKRLKRDAEAAHLHLAVKRSHLSKPRNA
jgi:hypothetical protein